MPNANPSPEPWPHRLLSWYGDDFTGSTDVLEVLARAGLEPVLFLTTPDADALAGFRGARAIGIAGQSRAKDPAWMDAELPAAMIALAALDAPLLLYKVCSTFDSSPAVGSIGRALDIGRRVTGEQHMTPVIVGAPALRRYTAFGHLFAADGDATHRIDRHPTMAAHPLTPMGEADLARHLAQQTTLPTAVFDFVALKADDYAERYAAFSQGPAAGIVDVLDEETLQRAGELLWTHRGTTRFCVGSSGVAYALVAYWRAAAAIAVATPLPPAEIVPQLLAVSGSCSPATAAQIDEAERAGYALFRLDVAAAIDHRRERTLSALQDAASAAWDASRNVLVHSARGPGDPAVAELRDAAARAGIAMGAAGARVGEALGTVFRELVARHAPRRIAIAGGDTSGQVARMLHIDALSMRAPLAPGSPLCVGHARDPKLDGIEVVLKGGQVGGRHFFEDTRHGRASPTWGESPSNARRVA